MSPAWLKQCRSERSRREFCEKYRRRAYRSPSLGRVLLRTSYFFKHRSLHEVMPAPKHFMCILALSSKIEQQENYKLVFQSQLYHRQYKAH